MLKREGALRIFPFPEPDQGRLTMRSVSRPRATLVVTGSLLILVTSSSVLLLNDGRTYIGSTFLFQGSP